MNIEHCGPNACRWEKRTSVRIRALGFLHDMKFRNFCSKLLLAGLFLHSSALDAKQVRINLGTIAPQGSSIHQALLAMREKWRQAPEGGVRLVIYPDGVQGGEADMVRLMRIDLLQAGLFTAIGISQIEPGVTALQNMPMVFRDLREYDIVSQALRPMLEARIEEQGFITLFWADAGWIRFFSKRPLVYPDDLKDMKLFVWAGSHGQAGIMRDIGFHPVLLETADILPGLQTGLIDAVSAPPIFALATQIDTRAPYMLELNYAPLMGAAIIRKKAWKKIPVGAREILREAAETAGREINRRARKEGIESVKAMERRGLKVKKVTPEIEQKWIEKAESIYPKLRGSEVPEDVFDEVLRLLRESRSGG